MITILTLTLGCAYNETLPEKDLTGTVVLPAAALTRTLFDGSTVTDPRLIGPVFLGAFAGMDDISFGYPHPSMGPIVTPDVPGDTFPYGGTTVGRFDFACYQALACKVVTGRFESYDDVLDYFANTLNNPVKDADGEVVDYASTFQQECFDYFYATSDAEMAFLGDLDFQENSDGDWEAEFLMPHTLVVDGMVLWGWMDAPAIDLGNAGNSGAFSTCTESGGREYQSYDQDFYEGRVYYDVLNAPSTYISNGDWISQGTDAEIIHSEDDHPVVRMDFGFGVEE